MKQSKLHLGQNAIVNEKLNLKNLKKKKMFSVGATCGMFRGDLARKIILIKKDHVEVRIINFIRKKYSGYANPLERIKKWINILINKKKMEFQK